MKKSLIKTIIVVITSILVIFSIYFYSKYIHKIDLIENIRNIVKQTQKENEKTSENVTIIDVTGLKTGAEISHEHIFKSQYDDTNHWEECIICNKKQNIATHTMKTSWASGKESCNRTNSYVSNCTCGFSKSGHKPCVWDGKSYMETPNSEGGFVHIKKCSVCKEHINHSYYLNGKLYEMQLEEGRVGGEEQCYKSDGTKLTCDNLGVCSICKQSRTIKWHKMKIDLENGKIYCQTCYKEFGTCSQEISKNMNTAPTTYTIITTLNLSNGATFAETGLIRGSATQYSNRTQKVTSIDSTKTQVVITTTATFKNTWKAVFEAYIRVFINADGRKCVSDSTWFNIYPDPIQPEISNIVVGNSEESDWKKSKTITVSGTENYCNTVSLEILDDKRNSIYKGTGTVTNKNYSITCTPELEANAEGKIFTAIVTDVCENSISQEFVVSKIDGISPEITSEIQIAEEWSASKECTFSATDSGIGDVQIAFNNTNEYTLANFENNIYSRKYKFIGDIYKPTIATIYYKDGLNNTSIQKMTIDKIDNTAPNITNINIHNNKLLVTSNDIKEGLGEGSGVSKYRYITSVEKLINPEIPETAIEVNSNENIIVENISEVKYIYVLAEDLVGNVSKVYEYEVPRIKFNKQTKLK